MELRAVWACIGLEINDSNYFDTVKTHTKSGPVQSPKCAEVGAVGLGEGFGHAFG